MKVELVRILTCTLLFVVSLGGGLGEALADEAPPQADEAPPQADEAPPQADEAPPLAGYNGSFFLRSADGIHSLKIGGRVQARYTFDSPGDEPDESYFNIPRARLFISGNTLTEGLRYKFETDLGKGTVSLKDFFLEYDLNSTWLRLRVGQFKMPFSRQQLHSSGRLALVDRSPTDKAFNAGRDIGLMFLSDWRGAPFEYALGLFNGAGVKSTPDRFDPMIVYRLGYAYGGIRGYREGDFEGGGLRFGLGLNGMLDFSLDEGADQDAAFRAGFDYVVKVHGFSTTGAVYIESEGSTFESLSDEATSERQLGFHVQASYYLADMILPSVRYTRLMPQGDDNDQSEIAAGLGLIFFGHRLKWQTDAVVILDEAEGVKPDVTVRSQVQIYY